MKPVPDESGRSARSTTPIPEDSGRSARSTTPIPENSGRSARSTTPATDESGRFARSTTPATDESGRSARSTTPTPENSGRSARSTTPVIDLKGITKTYGMGDTEVHALRGIDMTIDRGDYVAIMGASGSGKSTLMNIVGALDAATSGHYALDGISIDDLDESALSIVRNRKIGFIFQSFNLIPRTSALSNVELPLVYRGVRRKERRERAMGALNAVGLADRVHHMPNELSGGQQQRVAVARALVAEPSLLLADEPTGNLDSKSTRDVLDLMGDLHDQGRTIVMITHEDDVAAHAGRVVTLIDGQISDDHRNPPRATGTV